MKSFTKTSTFSKNLITCSTHEEISNSCATYRALGISFSEEHAYFHGSTYIKQFDNVVESNNTMTKVHKELLLEIANEILKRYS